MRVYVVTFALFDYLSEERAAEVVGVYLHEPTARQALRERARREEFPDLAESHQGEVHAVDVDETTVGDWK